MFKSALPYTAEGIASRTFPSSVNMFAEVSQLQVLHLQHQNLLQGFLLYLLQFLGNLHLNAAPFQKLVSTWLATVSPKITEQQILQKTVECSCCFFLLSFVEPSNLVPLYQNTRSMLIFNAFGVKNCFCQSQSEPAFIAKSQPASCTTRPAPSTLFNTLLNLMFSKTVTSSKDFLHLEVQVQCTDLLIHLHKMMM